MIFGNSVSRLMYSLSVGNMFYEFFFFTLNVMWKETWARQVFRLCVPYTKVPNGKSQTEHVLRYYIVTFHAPDLLGDGHNIVYMTTDNDVTRLAYHSVAVK